LEFLHKQINLLAFFNVDRLIKNTAEIKASPLFAQ
jgi:hypothetical protein